MAFLRNKPAAADLLSTSQGVIKNNFNGSDDSFAVDHFPFSDTTSKNGTHKQVQLSETILGAIPAGLKGLTYETLYASTTGNGGQLFYVQGNNAQGVQLTGPYTPKTGNFGYTFLPGGMLMQWGFITLPGTSNPSGTVLFTTNNINFPNACFNVQLSLNANSTTASANTASSIGTPTNLQFKWNFTGSTSYNFIYWTAIGN